MLGLSWEISEFRQLPFFTVVWTLGYQSSSTRVEGRHVRHKVSARIPHLLSRWQLSRDKWHIYDRDGTVPATGEIQPPALASAGNCFSLAKSRKQRSLPTVLPEHTHVCVRFPHFHTAAATSSELDFKKKKISARAVWEKKSYLTHQGTGKVQQEIHDSVPQHKTTVSPLPPTPLNLPGPLWP